jgi:hypothetical protein
MRLMRPMDFMLDIPGPSLVKWERISAKGMHPQLGKSVAF